ncbi:protein phosphatase 1 regulatory subunit 21-like isoform X1 [Rhopilema esculentum]|uniref:protein phosphatase 1 regulatory subunit 21-like isoform X1 n=1 Tax=Rhopilema esculentum TaxID=499914 RepID=UPI0031DEB16F
MKDFNENIKEQSFISLKTCTGLSQFAIKFTEFTSYLDKLLSYHVLSNKEECSWSSCSEDIEKENKEFMKFTNQLTVTMSRLRMTLCVLASFGSNKINVSESGPCFKLMVKQMKKLFEVSQELCRCYQLKMLAEEQLPMITERLRSTDQCIMSSLAGIAGAASKFVKFFDDNIEFITANNGFKRKGVVGDGEEGISSAIKLFHSKATGYLQSLRKDVPITVPYEIAVKNNRTLMTSTESRDTLAEEVTHSKETIAKLEQEKQHWLLEAQLLQAKFEKEVKKVASLSDELGKLKTEAINSRQSPETIDDVLQRDKSVGIVSPPPLMREASSGSTSAEPVSFSHPIGTLEVWNKERQDTGDSDRDHEELVKNHLTARINDLTKQLQLADSKGVTHYAECRALYKQLVLADKSKKRIANELAQAKSRLGTLEDDLETTKRSYEDQIKMLSDHLCGMNDKLTSQKDQIDLLKTATPSKGSNKLGFGRKKQA